MSPTAGSVWTWTWRFPRVSGDEPVNAPQTQVDITFSPRERG